MPKSALLHGVILGVLTGVIGSLLVPALTALLRPFDIQDLDLLYLLTAGGSFGLGLGLYLRAVYGLGKSGLALWVIATPVLYFGAVWVAIFSYDKVEFGHEMLVPGLVGGAAGGLMVAALLVLTLGQRLGHRLGLQNWRALVGWVTLTGALMGAAALWASNMQNGVASMLLLHVPWHAGVLGAVLARLASGHDRN